MSQSKQAGEQVPALVASMFKGDDALITRVQTAITSQKNITYAIEYVIGQGGLSLDHVKSLQWIREIFNAAQEDKLLASYLLQRYPVPGSLSKVAIENYHLKDLPCINKNTPVRFRAHLMLKEPLAVLLASIKANEILFDKPWNDIIAFALEWAIKNQVLIGSAMFQEKITSKGFFDSVEESRTIHSGAVLSRIMALQRLQYLVTEPQHIKHLIDFKFESAQDIAYTSRKEFVQNMKRRLDEEAALKIHDHAVVVACRSQETWVNLLTMINEDFMATEKAIADVGKPEIIRPTPPDEDPTKPHEAGSKKDFNMTSIFDLQDTPCEECCSVVSASAYFVDLLKFLEHSRCSKTVKGADNVLKALALRRPDLQRLQLSCANSKNMVSYITIVNEILASYIASEGGSISAVDEDDPSTSQGQVSEEEKQLAATCDSKIAKAMFPLNRFPYSLGEDSVRVYLSSMGIEPSDVRANFKSTTFMLRQLINFIPSDSESREALEKEAEAVWHRFDVAETLHMLPRDFAAVCKETIFTDTFLDLLVGLCPEGSAQQAQLRDSSIPTVYECWGYDDVDAMLDTSEQTLSGLCFIQDQLLPRSGLSLKELLELLNTTFFGRRLVIVNSRGSKVFDGQLSEMRLRLLDNTSGSGKGDSSKASPIIGNLTQEICHELQGFIRLRNKLGWTITDLDVVISTITQNHIANSTISSVEGFRGITLSVLEDIAQIAKLSKLTQVSVASLLPIWAPISTHGDNSLYRKVFFEPMSYLSNDTVFRPDSGGSYLRDKGAIETYMAPLTMTLKTTSEDLNIILAIAGLNPSSALELETLSKMYRHTLMCRLLGVRPKDYDMVLSVLPDRNIFVNPKTTMESISLWKQLTDGGWSTSDIMLLVGKTECTNIPLSDHALQFTASIMEKFNSIKAFWEPRIQNDIVTSRDVMDLCGQLFDAVTSKSLAQIVEGDFVVSKTINLDPSKSLPSFDGLPSKLSIDVNRKANKTQTAVVTLRGILTDQEEKESLGKIGDSLAFADAIRELDKLSKISYNALIARFSDERNLGQKKVIADLMCSGLTLTTTDAASLSDESLSTSSEEEDDSDSEGSGSDETLTEDSLALESAGVEKEEALRTRRLAFVKLMLPILRSQTLVDLATRSISERLEGIEHTLIPMLLSKETSSEEKKSAIDILQDIQGFSADEPPTTQGYFLPTATGEYIFSLRPSNPVIDVYLSVNGAKMALKKTSTEWYSDPVLMTTGQTYLLVSPVQPMDVMWATKQTVPASFTDTTFIAQDRVQKADSVLKEIGRSAWLFRKLELSLEEVKYLTTPNGLISIDLNSLSIDDIARLQSYRRLRDGIAKQKDSLVRLFAWLENPDSSSNLTSQLIAATTWPEAQLSTLIKTKYDYEGAKAADIIGAVASLGDLITINAIMEISGALRPNSSQDGENPIISLFKFATPALPGSAKQLEVASEMVLLLGKRQLKSCTSQLQETQRTAFIEYLLQQPYIKKYKISDAGGLFDLLLIDVQMGSQFEITRMKQAISTVQLYVQRCLLGMETEAGVQPSNIDQIKWAWMHKHNIWTATRKAFLYPENWIDPTLRDDKTVLFGDYESTIMQKDLSWDTFAQAIRTYVKGLSEIADLDIQAYLRHHPTGGLETYHFFGKTRSTPYRFYYRNMRLTQPSDVALWTPWALMDIGSVTYEADWDGSSVTNPGAYLIPVMRGNRLILYIPEIMVKTLTPETPKGEKVGGLTFGEAAGKSLNTTKSPNNWEIRMAWTELLNGEWTPKRVSQPVLNVVWDNRFDKEKLPSISRFTFWANTTGLVGETITINVGCWRKEKVTGNSVAATDAANHSFLGSFQISDDRASVKESQTQSESENRTLETVFHKYTWTKSWESRKTFDDDRVETPGQQVALFKGDHVTSPLLAVPVPTSSRTLVWTMSYDGNDTLAKATGYVVDVQVSAPDGKTTFMYPKLAYAKRNKVELASSNLVRNSMTEVIEHSSSPTFMQDITKTDSLGPLFETMDKMNEREFGKAVVEANVSQYHEQATSYALYNWELGAHCVLLAIDRFLATQQYDLALRVARLVFDPTVDVQGQTRKQAKTACWRFRPFRDIAGDPTENQDNFTGWLDESTLDVAVTERRRNPSNTHATARTRPRAYMKWIVMKYIETLIAAGDEYFRQGSIESLPMAIQRYIEAAHVLGPEPPKMPKLGKPAVKTYDTLNKMGKMRIDLELTFPFLCDVERRGTKRSEVDEQDRYGVLGILTTTYFCLPANPKYQAMRSLVNDRLYKARNNMDINGRPLLYAMNEASIDPGQIGRALQGGGGGVTSLLNEIDGPMPNQRFQYLISKALDICTSLQSMGDQFLQAKEKKDSEALQILKAKQDTARQRLSISLKRLQRDEIERNIELLEMNRSSAEAQLRYYLRLIGEPLSRIPGEAEKWVDIEQAIEAPLTDDLRMNRLEYQEMKVTEVANKLNLAASAIDVGALILKALPQVTTNVEPMGVGASMKMDGSNIASALQASSLTIRTGSMVASTIAADAQRTNSLTKQLQERRLQANMKGQEIKSLDKQTEIQRKRLELNEKETSIQQAEIDNAVEMEQWYQSKYTNEKLYGWMENTIRNVHYDLYQLASDLARRAQNAFRFEKGSSVQGFLRPGGYWDSSHDGLLAAQQLQADLRRMEAAYLERSSYDYEIVKNISLRQLNPEALLNLRADGTVTFDIPEVLYDFDFPGHYMRRIKSVSLSVPCVVGPYTGLNATLRLLQHRYRVSSVAASGEDYAEDGMASGHFRTDIVPITSVAISSGIQDSGVFELNFKDDRFQPFEGAGAIGTWSLELPTVVRSFDYSTISDVILHVRYTAVDGGPLLRNAANQAVKTFRSRVEGLSSEGPGLFAMFDLKNDFSSAWYAFRSGLASKTIAELDLSGFKDRFPYWALGKNITITSLSLVISGKVTKSKLVQELFSITALGEGKDWDPVRLGNATMLTLSPLNTKLNDTELEWKLKVSNEGGDFTALENVILILRQWCGSFALRNSR
ncbi:toxin subunit [Fusarium pseudoanthophilum]|uniref:Toxin subunit n=1 Tax=Fusarium pseudoanthophilum TaxID=48495 RepID=A0A8H5NRU6_9HYPO|nr:toxin subunit [Fusarium pseudoanthophilum]